MDVMVLQQTLLDKVNIGLSVQARKMGLNSILNVCEVLQYRVSTFGALL